ncbi:NAD(P)H-dependent oxidoreductase [Coprobacter tertius]|uniref:NAD(P)H-dependent oxidoreductase n=1 Tax=Coprobacter tertius TaxID=2944915 RepID=UPI003F491C27
MPMKRERIMVLLAHPDMERSQGNKALIEAIKDYPQVDVVNLCEENFFDAEEFAEKINMSKAVIFQFPFYWASAPASMKKWIDEIFTPIAKTDIVKGKPLLIVTTTASEAGAYRSGGRNHFTIDELLRPYQLLANHLGMVWQTPLAVCGLSTASVAVSIEEGCKLYREKIEYLISF